MYVFAVVLHVRRLQLGLVADAREHGMPEGKVVRRVYESAAGIPHWRLVRRPLSLPFPRFMGQVANKI